MVLSIFTTNRHKNHELDECPVIVTSLWDFENIGVNFLSTHIKSLTGLPRRGKMLVECKIRKTKSPVGMKSNINQSVLKIITR